MRVILCRGVFDLLHVAHVRHLNEARSMGDYLVVSLTTDAVAEREKRKPITPEKERREMLLGLRCVSCVDLEGDWRESIIRWRPNVYVKGHDHKVKGISRAEREFCDKYGARIAFTKENPQHTSKIIRRLECV